ncbi:MAG: hypothetical protein ACI38Q_06445 [Candidatus Bruticola sp.]
MKINWREMWSLQEPGPPEAGQAELESDIKQLAQSIVSIHLGVPALWFLESCRPLHFIGSQALVFLSPAAGLLGLEASCRRAAEIAARPSQMEALMEAIEQLEIEKNEQHAK